MSEINRSTAILLFSRSVREEARAKSWLGRQKNRRIAKLLIKFSYKEAKNSGIPVFLHESPFQIGNTFGEKITNAFESVFARGYEQVICIGNDTPDLSSQDIAGSAKALQSGKNWVLGPSHDGGAYLIGMKKSCFQQLDLQSLPWQSNQLYGRLQDALIRVGQGVEMSFKKDIDTAKDLFELISQHARQLKPIQLLYAVLLKSPLPLSFDLPLSLQKEIPLLSGFFRGPPHLS